MTEDEIVGLHHQFNGHELGQTPGDGKKERSDVLQSMVLQRVGAFELWCWRRLLESPLGCKEIKPVNLKGNQP